MVSRWIEHLTLSLRSAFNSFLTAFPLAAPLDRGKPRFQVPELLAEPFMLTFAARMWLVENACVFSHNNEQETKCRHGSKWILLLCGHVVYYCVLVDR